MYFNWSESMRFSNTYLFVYILECADGSYYTGVTNDLNSRFNAHQQGLNSRSYTAKRLPVKLVYSQGFQNAKDAIAFEKKLKKWTIAKKQALINNDFETLMRHSKKKFNN